MGTEIDLQKVFRNRGRFAVGPTDLTADFPHGGAGVGWVTDIVLRQVIGQVPIRASEFGEIVDVLTTERQWIFAATVREFDLNLLDPIFTINEGSTTGEDLATYPGERSGTLQAANGLKLVFSPEDTKNPAAIFYNAILLPEETSVLNFRLNDDMTFGIVAYAIRDGSGRVVQIGNLRDIVL